MNFLKKLMNNRQNKSFQGETGERNRAESTLRGELNQSKGYKLGRPIAIWNVILNLFYQHRDTKNAEFGIFCFDFRWDTENQNEHLSFAVHLNGKWKESNPSVPPAPRAKRAVIIRIYIFCPIKYARIMTCWHDLTLCPEIFTYNWLSWFCLRSIGVKDFLSNADIFNMQSQ